MDIKHTVNPQRSYFGLQLNDIVKRACFEWEVRFKKQFEVPQMCSKYFFSVFYTLSYLMSSTRFYRNELRIELKFFRAFFVA